MPAKVDLDRDEVIRILRAVREGRMQLRKDVYRWGIDGERAPHSRTRVLLVKRGLIDEYPPGRTGIGPTPVLTERGQRELAQLEGSDAQDPPSMRMTHAPHGMSWCFGPYGPQDVHVHSCIADEHGANEASPCDVVWIGLGRTCEGGMDRHQQANLDDRASVENAAARLRPPIGLTLVDRHDLELLDRHLRDMRRALSDPATVANLKEAADMLASAAAPFGRLRVQINEAVAKVAVHGEKEL
jgi:hypothetical protein